MGEISGGSKAGERERESLDQNRGQTKNAEKREKEECWCKHEDESVRNNQDFRKRARNLVVGNITEGRMRNELVTEEKKGKQNRRERRKREESNKTKSLGKLKFAVNG